ALRGVDLGPTADLHMVERDPATGGARFITAPAGGGGVARFTTVIPPARASAPAIQALASAPPRLVEDVQDYRGADVIAAIRPVANSRWRLIVKVDASEAFAVPRRMAVATVTAFGAAVGILG